MQSGGERRQFGYSDIEGNLTTQENKIWLSNFGFFYLPIVAFFHLLVNFRSSFFDRFAGFEQLGVSFIRDEARMSCFRNVPLNFHKFFFVLRNFDFTDLIRKY
jgi:hypothetical protein